MLRSKTALLFCHILIIEKQEELIELLYREDTASEEMKALKHEAEEKQAMLQKRRGLLPKL